jgi:hypothetical protein
MVERARRRRSVATEALGRLPTHGRNCETHPYTLPEVVSGKVENRAPQPRHAHLRTRTPIRRHILAFSRRSLCIMPLRNSLQLPPLDSSVPIRPCWGSRSSRKLAPRADERASSAATCL